MPPSSGLLIALMMEEAGISETLVNFYQTTRCYNPEDSHLRTHRRENLKSCLNLVFYFAIILNYQKRPFFVYVFLKTNCTDIMKLLIFL
jgi:hypothetical protein